LSRRLGRHSLGSIERKLKGAGAFYDKDCGGGLEGSQSFILRIEMEEGPEGKRIRENRKTLFLDAEGGEVWI